MFLRLGVQTTNDATLPERSVGKNKGYQFGYSKFCQSIMKNANLSTIGIFAMEKAQKFKHILYSKGKLNFRFFFDWYLTQNPENIEG